MAHTDTHEEFYKQFTSRQQIIISPEEQKKIREAVFIVAGIGANGGPAAIALARMGAENIRLIDHDIVEISNLNRQPYFLSEVGMYKVDALRRYIKSVNPFASVDIFRERLNETNVDEVLNNADVVIDAMDDYRAKIILSRKAKEKHIPVVHTSGAGYRCSVTVFFPDVTTYEEMFDLPSLHKDISSIKESDLLYHRHRVASIIAKGMYPESLIEEMRNPNQPWLTMLPAPFIAGVLAAMEAIKIVIGRLDKVIAAPKILQIDVVNNIYEIFIFKKEKITAYY